MTTKRNSLPRWTIETTLRPNEQVCLFWWTNKGFKGRSNQTADLITMTSNQMSHMSQYFPALAELLFHWHTPCLWRKCLGWFVGTVAQLPLIGSDHCTHFLQLAGDPWSLSSYQEPSQRDEIPPSNFEGTAICQQIKVESHGTAAHRSSLSISGQILPAVDWMRCVKMIRGDNSGESSSFAAKLSPWFIGGGKP